MFGNAAGNGGKSNANSNSNPKNKSNVSSVMGSKGKETPLMSFLRGKSGVSNTRNMMSMTGQQQQQMSAQGLNALNNSNHSANSHGSSFRDSASIDVTSSGNPFLRRHMMSNLDRSVNPGARRGVHEPTGSGLSTTTRQSMMQQMTSSASMSKSAKELGRKKGSSDFYESAGIVARHSSADNIVAPSRRTGLTAGAAKAQNRRFQTLRRTNTSGSMKSLPCKTGATSSTKSLSSEDSTGSLRATKARTASGGRRGSGVKHQLRGSGGSALRLSSHHRELSGSALNLQRGRENQLQQTGTQHNDGWP